MTNAVNTTGLKAFRPIILTFIFLNGGIFATRSLLAKYNISADVLLAGNLILFVAIAVSFYFYYRSLQDNRATAILRMVYLGMFVKLLLCIFSAFIYIMMTGKNVNKGGIVGCLVLYVLYTAMEISILMKVSKQKKNV
ncbi:MAG: hypothetical protein H7Y31_10225 [Chitinophagaceae bacterium]|nr:hypothetical protein [Chitinophagaceae bacterium]